MLRVLFQEWLQRHGPFDAVVDGANTALYNQHTFNFGQVSFDSAGIVPFVILRFSM